MTPQKTIALPIRTFVSQVMSLLFNMLSRFVIAFLPRSKHLLISWLQSLSTAILEPKKIISVTVSNFSLSMCHEVMDLDAVILGFWMLSFKPAFSHSYFNLIKSLQFLFTFCHYSCVICISEVTGNSLSSLNFSFASSNPTFCMMYSAYKLNKQGDDVQPCHIPFPIWNQSCSM